jgi:hypothetical protein
MKNAAICPGYEPSHCEECGAELVRAPAPKGPHHPKTGEPTYSHRMKCPKRRWWNCHPSYIVQRNGIWLDEQWMCGRIR